MKREMAQRYYGKRCYGRISSYSIKTNKDPNVQVQIALEGFFRFDVRLRSSSN
jgi:hypothetical protein